MTMTERIRYRRRPARIIRRQDTGPSILDAIADPQMFRPWFKNVASWEAWFAFLAALFCLPMTDDQLQTYRECTGRTEPPDEIAKEGWLVVGRRGGKSLILAVIAIYLATFRSYTQYLQPGERGTIVIIAADRKQARTIFRYIGGFLKNIPMLARLIEREAQEAFDLTNQVSIEIHTASFRSTRGYTVIAALLDEAAFWRSDDSTNPDTEILAALRPAMVTIPGAILLCASSPYSRRGILWNAHRKYFGKAGNILVWQAATRRMNPSVSQEFIDEAYADDAASASAEYGAQFRTDIEALVSREVVEACVSLGVFERAPIRGIRYSAFCDPSGGSADSMCLAIGHEDRDTDGAILDLLRERKPPFSPEAVVSEFCDLLRQYRIAKVIGDRFGGEFVAELFKRNGIVYEASARPKSALYQDVLPLLNSKKADLLDNERLVNQFVGLERKTARGGRDSIDHAPGGHDDLCNVAAGVLVNLVVSKSSYTLDYVSRDREERRSPAVDRLASLESMMTARFW
jgi:hypothetical protein